jgi:hypothetical protein
MGGAPALKRAVAADAVAASPMPVRRRAGWRRFVVLAVALFVAYHTIILGLFVYRAGAWPNYFKIQGFVPEVLELISYHPSWREWVTLVPDQPVYIYASVYEKTQTMQWLFVFTLKNLMMSIALSLLVALNLVLMRARRLSSNVGTCAAGVTGLFGAGVSAAACCGTASSSMVLSALGVGGGIIAVIAEHSTALGWLGLALLVANAAYLARRRPAREEVTR